MNDLTFLCTILHYIIISHSLFNIKYGAYASGTISDLLMLKEVIKSAVAMLPKQRHWFYLSK